MNKSFGILYLFIRYLPTKSHQHHFLSLTYFEKNHLYSEANVIEFKSIQIQSI
jgi:hypothetical protein